MHRNLPSSLPLHPRSLDSELSGPLVGSDEQVPPIALAGHSVLDNSDLIGSVAIDCDSYSGSEWDIARRRDGQALDRDCAGGREAVGLTTAHGARAISC